MLSSRAGGMIGRNRRPRPMPRFNTPRVVPSKVTIPKITLPGLDTPGGTVPRARAPSFVAPVAARRFINPRQRSNSAALFGHSFFAPSTFDSPVAFAKSPYFQPRRSFSTVPDVDLSVPLDNTRKPTAKKVLNALETVRYNKVTARGSVPSILSEGLLAKFGGTGGAGDAFARSNPGSMATAEYFKKTSRDKVHIGKGPDSESFYTDVFSRGAMTEEQMPHSLVMYLPKGIRSRLKTDPVDPQPGRYRLFGDIPAKHVMPRDLLIRAPGVIGADYAPLPAIDTVREALPPRSRGRNLRAVTEDIRESLHGGRMY